MRTKLLMVAFIAAATAAGLAISCGAFSGTNGSGGSGGSGDGSDAGADGALSNDASAAELDGSPAPDAAPPGALGSDAGLCDGPCTCVARVFITSEAFTPGMNLSPDQWCQTLAQGAEQTGTFRAWIAHGDAGPASYMTHSTCEYRRVDGVRIAKTWADFASPIHEAPIDVNELGKAYPSPTSAWTGVNEDGLVVSGDCDGWTSTSNNGLTVARTGTTDPMFQASWSSYSMYSCGNPGGSPLYCVEQK